MDPGTVGDLTKAALELIGGVYIALMGFRWIGRPPGQDFKVDQWHERWGTLLKVVGPGMIAVGLYQAGAATVWK